MAVATRFSVMSKQIEDNKQATDDFRAQMADLAKSQADLCKSASHMEAMLSQFISQNGAQTNRTPILNSPSGCLTASTTLNRMLAELKATTANREATMSKFLSPTLIPHRPPFPPPEPPDLAKLFESPLLHTPAIHPRAPFRPNQNQNNQESIETGSSIQQIESSGVKDVMSTTHKADSVSGEGTITSNASESSQVSSQVSPYHLPVFDGTLPDCWIVEVDRFFELKQYGNEEKLDLISLSLEGAALKWFRRHRREFTDWTDTKRKLMARFGLIKGCSPPEVLPKEKLITKNQMLMLGYHGLEVQVLSCLQEFGEGSKMGTRIVLCWKKLASSLWFLHGKKLLDAGQKVQSMLVYDEEKNGLRNTGAVNKKEKYIFSGNIKLIKQSLSRDNELIWTQFSSLVKASEMSLLGHDKWKWSEKHRMYNKAWNFKYIQRLMLSVLLQMEQYKLLQGRTIKCKMRKKEVLRRIKQSIFIEMQFHMKNNSEFNFQANTKDAELETTLTDRDTFQKPLEDLYRACAYDYMALRVLELIKDKASRKRKLCKNWWFKYKLNTWLSEALHFWRKRKYEKLQILGRATHGLLLKQSFSQVLLHIQNRDYSFFGYMLVATSLVETENIYSFSGKDTHMEGEIMGFKLLLTSGLNWKKFIEWVKIYFSEKQYQENTRLMRSATTKLIRSDFCHLFVQKIHVIWALHNFEKTVAATKVNQNSESSQDCYLLLFLERVKASFEIKFTMEQSEKPLITILSYEWFHSPRPPELSCCKEDEEYTAKISFLRTRMI